MTNRADLLNIVLSTLTIVYVCIAVVVYVARQLAQLHVIYSFSSPFVFVDIYRCVR